MPLASKILQREPWESTALGVRYSKSNSKHSAWREVCKVKKMRSFSTICLLCPMPDKFQKTGSCPDCVKSFHTTSVFCWSLLYYHLGFNTRLPKTESQYESSMALRACMLAYLGLTSWECKNNNIAIIKVNFWITFLRNFLKRKEKWYYYTHSTTKTSGHLFLVFEST